MEVDRFAPDMLRHGRSTYRLIDGRTAISAVNDDRAPVVIPDRLENVLAQRPQRRRLVGEAGRRGCQFRKGEVLGETITGLGMFASSVSGVLQGDNGSKP